MHLSMRIYLENNQYPCSVQINQVFLRRTELSTKDCNVIGFVKMNIVNAVFIFFNTTARVKPYSLSSFSYYNICGIDIDRFGMSIFVKGWRSTFAFRVIFPSFYPYSVQDCRMFETKKSTYDLHVCIRVKLCFILSRSRS